MNLIEKIYLHNLFSYLISSKDEFALYLIARTKNVNEITEIILNDKKIKKEFLNWSISFMEHKQYNELNYFNYPNKNDFIKIFKN